MDPYPLLFLSLFILCLVFSAALSGIRTMVSLFQRLSEDHNLDISDAKISVLAERSAKLWQKRGFYESASLGRFLFNAMAILTGTHFLSFIFGGLNFFVVGFLIAMAVYLFSHWLVPLLSHITMRYWGTTAIWFYQVYSFLLMGKAGELLSHLQGWFHNKIGYDERLSFLNHEQMRELKDEEDEVPDTSGLHDDEKEMIRSIFEMKDTQVKEIMTPRVDIIALEEGASYEEVLEMVKSEKFSRIPVFRETVDHIEGILHIMDLITVQNGERKNFELKTLIHEAIFVPRTKKIGELMREFRQNHIHMAMVVDEYGGIAGLVTLEDIIEEIVGEIHDEDELAQPKVKKVEDGVYLIDPIISLSDLNHELEILLKPDEENIEIDTLGGFILFVHGKVPEMGDVVRFKDFSFEIIEMDGQKLEKIRMTVPVEVKQA